MRTQGGGDEGFCYLSGLRGIKRRKGKGGNESSPSHDRHGLTRSNRVKSSGKIKSCWGVWDGGPCLLEEVLVPMKRRNLEGAIKALYHAIMSKRSPGGLSMIRFVNRVLLRGVGTVPPYFRDALRQEAHSTCKGGIGSSPFHPEVASMM